MSEIRRAGIGDRDDLLEMIEEFYEIDRHDFDLERVAGGLDPLLLDDRFGQVWIVDAADGPAAGYAVVTWSWSLESGGLDCILDELYLRRRGQGLGGRVLRQVVEAAAEAGAAAMFLETEAHNTRVRSFYLRSGFSPEDSVWMSRRLAPE